MAQDKLVCTRCNVTLESLGTRNFRTGSAFLEEALGGLFAKSENLDMYCCPQCGHVELFVDGVGEDLRQE